MQLLGQRFARLEIPRFGRDFAARTAQLPTEQADSLRDSWAMARRPLKKFPPAASARIGRMA
jgi:hypothetical protein